MAIYDEEIQYIVARYHIRDASENDDGSRGSIKISPKQLYDELLAMKYRGDKEIFNTIILRQ